MCKQKCKNNCELKSDAEKRCGDKFFRVDSYMVEVKSPNILVLFWNRIKRILGL